MITDRAPLIEPCGGMPIDLLAHAEDRESLKARAASLPSNQFTGPSICDLVRTHLSKGLEFSEEDRDTNIIVRHGGTVICAAISPYRSTRAEARRMAGGDGFVEVFVDTPLEVCEVRDVNGIYAKARRGEIKGFTGIDDPYEAPEHPEIKLNAVTHTPEENARFILSYLVELGFVRSADHATVAEPVV